VILSGIWGVAVYASLPAKLADNRRGMTKQQMLASLDALDRQLETAAQPLGRTEADLVIAALEQDIFAGGLVTRLSGRNPRCRTRAGLEQMADNAETQKVLSLLRKREAQLDQIRRHLRLRAMLEVWLYIHVPVTIALLGALTAHIVSVFYYW